MGVRGFFFSGVDGNPGQKALYDCFCYSWPVGSQGGPAYNRLHPRMPVVGQTRK
jgi:hypothetical protein